ncbi:MAG: formylglycine-generating enzyme family protein [Anaerolineae bacterium]|nr:formylglycine-generating enzyme family protein [Anaerolineae bacterium]
MAQEGVPLQALSGVTRNADWAPGIVELDGVPMAFVPAGCFQMGSMDGDDDEAPVHEVCFERPFWIDVYEVTNQQYRSSGFWAGDDLPRESVNWFDAAAHCESRGARLPAEVEWEYAARGPDGLIYPWGDEFTGDYVVWNVGQTAPVGSKPGGASWVGALDMTGNVWEWAADWYDDYPSGRQVNPTGPESGSYRVLRGGAWDYGDTIRLRAANRYRIDPGNVGYDYGFRCALSH